MDPVSSVSLVSENVSEKAKKSHRKLLDVLNDPRQTIVFMIAVGFLLAFVFVVVNYISDLLSVGSGVDALQEQNKTQVVEVEKTDFDKIRKQNIDQINAAILNYYRKNSQYPQSLSNLVPNYIFSLPKDPETGQNFGYRVSLDFKTYEVWAFLDDGSEYLQGN